MFNVREYASTPKRLSDRLTWALLLEDGVILNKDASLMRCFEYQGPDLASSTRQELISANARLNNILRRLGSNWAIFTESQCRQSAHYPDSVFPDKVSLLLDEERRAAYGASDRHFENRYYITLVYLPPEERLHKLGNVFVDDHSGVAKDANYTAIVETFRQQTDRFLDLLTQIMVFARVLHDEDVLTYLHACVSDKFHPVQLPSCTMYLDSYLTDSAFTGGLAPVLGQSHLRVISLRHFPNASFPGILDDLNRLNFEYRYVNRFIALDKLDAMAVTRRYFKRWFQKRKGLGAIVSEIFSHRESPVVNVEAEEKAKDAEAARLETEQELVSQGYFSSVVVVWDTDIERVEQKAAAVESLFNGKGFTTIYEKLNAYEAWLGSLPGHCYANVRRPILNSLNLCHLMPFSALWVGPAQNPHLDGPALLVADTEGSRAFHFNTHHGELGHVLVVGPTRAGKTVLLNLAAAQFLRYPRAKVVQFDKDHGAMVTCLAMGGQHYTLDNEGAVAFQPLARIDEDAERTWAVGWLGEILKQEGVEASPETKDRLWSALLQLGESDRHHRTLTNFTTLLQSNTLRQAFAPFTQAGPYGHLFDNAADNLTLSHWNCFETGTLLQTPAIISPALAYLFHRIDALQSGDPMLLILDEGWKYLEFEAFSAKIREWLKTKAKKNVSVWFATQSIADAAESPIAPALLESCPTRIFLPNDRAKEEESVEYYRRFGLNDMQIDILAQATPRKHYYYQSAAGNRLFDLNLGPVALALTGSGSPDDIRLATTLAVEAEGEVFAARFLAEKGLAWAAELLDPVYSQEAMDHAKTATV